jgi:hypothetical protein
MTDQLFEQPVPTDANQNDEQPVSTTPPAAPMKRVFKIGANRVVEDEATARLSNEDARRVLQAAYPEVANATIREQIDAAANIKIVEFLPQPGRKG